MTRPLRIQYPDAWYHVMNRGRHGEAIFLDDTDYGNIIELFKETSAMWNIKIAAYCLMTNHYHLLLQTPQSNLDRCMRHINGIYTQRFNRRHHVDGQLFRGRYKAILVDADSYMLELVRYIHRNPLRAGIVKSIDDYQWSSYRGYISQSNSWKWLGLDFVLDILEKDRSKQIEAFVDFIKREDSEEVKGFYLKKNLPSVLGENGFIEKIRNRYFSRRKHGEKPETKLFVPEIKEIKEIVSKVYEVPIDSLFKSRRGFDYEARNVAIYLSRLYTGETLEKIGVEFNIEKYSTVSSIIGKIRDRVKVGKALKERIMQVEKLIEGQRQI